MISLIFEKTEDEFEISGALVVFLIILNIKTSIVRFLE
jgi:hypothetical protein